MIFLNGIEQVWLVSNSLVTLLTIAALVDAIADRNAVRLRNGIARTITARANVRREVLRLLVQALLLGALIPGALVDNPAVFSPVVILISAVPIVLLLSTFLDARTRRQLASLTTAQIETERNTVLEKLDALEAHVTVVGAEATVASDRAEAAVTEATARVAEAFGNATANNLKIADQAELISTLQPAIQETRDLTGEVHEAIVHPKVEP